MQILFVAISTLEQADILDNSDPVEYKRKKNLLRYVVVGGGFSGMETAGEINEFVREYVKEFYHSIGISEIEIILVNSGPRIIPEMDKRLGAFALKELRKNGVKVLLSNRVQNIQRGSIFRFEQSQIIGNAVDKTPLALYYSNTKGSEKIDETSLYVNLGDQISISTYTIIWTAGVTTENVLETVALKKDRKGRLLTILIKDLDCTITFNLV